MDLKNINLSEFIRYILTGFNFIFFVVTLPLIYLYPSTIKELLTETSVLTISILSIAIGYFLDIQKVYQLIPNFKKKNREFRNEVAKALEVPVEQAASYVSLVYHLLGKFDLYNIERRRSEWALSLYTVVILLWAAIIWIIILLYKYLTIGILPTLLIPLIGAILSLVSSARLLNISQGARERLDQDFMLILHKNKSIILKSWNLKDDGKKLAKRD
jgi:tellurite resistance protein TehA-like permease